MQLETKRCVDNVVARRWCRSGDLLALVKASRPTLGSIRFDVLDVAEEFDVKLPGSRFSTVESVPMHE